MTLSNTKITSALGKTFPNHISSTIDQFNGLGLSCDRETAYCGNDINTMIQTFATSSNFYLDLELVVRMQVTNLISRLTKKNYKQTLQDLATVSKNFDITNAILYLLETLLPNAHLKTQRDKLKIQLLAHLLEQLPLAENNWSTVINNVLQKLEHVSVDNTASETNTSSSSDNHDQAQSSLFHLLNILKFSALKELILITSLVCSYNRFVSQISFQYFRDNLGNLIKALNDSLNPACLVEILLSIYSRSNTDQQIYRQSLEILCNFYSCILNHPMPKILHVVASTASIDTIGNIGKSLPTSNPFTTTTSQSKIGKIRVDDHTTDILKSLEDCQCIVSSINVPPSDIIRDLGYACFQDLETSTAILKKIGKPLDEERVAQIIGMMASTHSNIDNQSTKSSATDLCSPLQCLSPPIYETTSSHSSNPSPINPKTWNLDCFVLAIANNNPSLSWSLTMKYLDYPLFSPLDQKGFELVLQVYRMSTNSVFPVETLLTKWHNFKAQIRMLNYIIQDTSDDISFSNVNPIESFPSLEDLVNSSVSIATSHKVPNPKKQIQQWMSISLVQILLLLSDESSICTQVTQILDHAVELCPDILLLTLTQSQGIATLGEKLANQLFASHLNLSTAGGSTYNGFIMQQLWAINQHSFLNRIIHYYQLNSKQHLLPLFQCIQKIDTLTTFLHHIPCIPLVINLALLAARTEACSFKFSDWVESSIQKPKESFLIPILYYLNEQCNEKHNELISYATLLDNPHLNTLFEAIKRKYALLSPANQKILRDLITGGQTNADHLKSELEVANCYSTVPYAPNSADEIDHVDGQNELFFPKHVEAEATRNLEKIYHSQWTSEQIISFFNKSITSDDIQYPGAFNCTIQHLINSDEHYARIEYYPEESLKITSLIFGLLIWNQFTDRWSHQAFQLVLRALRNMPGTKLFTFGQFALQHFQHCPSKISYCKQLLTIQHLDQHCPEIFSQIITILQDAEKNSHLETTINDTNHATVVFPSSSINQTQSLGKSNSNGGHSHSDTQSNNDASSISDANPCNRKQSSNTGNNAASSGSGGSSNSQSGNLGSSGGDNPKDDLLHSIASVMPQVEVPCEEVCDQIQFILNNVSFQNLEDKTALLKRILQDSYLDYFSQHIIVYRVSLTSMFQTLYLELIDKLNQPNLNEKVLSWTYVLIKHLLTIPKITTSPERTLLKNLGSWLGLLTLAREKPIFHLDLAIKELLLQSYQADTLEVMLPFVSKILATTVNKSKVFKVPNPWIVAILRLYKEFHEYPTVDQVVKIDIEVLFEALRIDLKTFKPAQLLLKYQNDSSSISSPSKLTSTSTAKSSSQMMSNQVASGPNPAMLPSKYNQKLASDIKYQHMGTGGSHWMPGLAQNLQLSQFFVQQVRIKQFLFVTFDRAIDHIIGTVVDRVMGFATKTTEKLVLKDFAMEPDENKLLRAAHIMAQSLSSSFASVISRPSLQNFIEQALRPLLPTFGDSVRHYLLEAIDINLDVACNVIEKHVTEKTLANINLVLRRAVQHRVMHREQQHHHGIIQPFYDMEYLSTSTPYPPQTLPEILRPMIRSPSQMSVYENFACLSEIIPPEEQTLNQQHHPIQSMSIDKTLQQYHHMYNKVDNLGRKQIPVPSNNISSSLKKNMHVPSSIATTKPSNFNGVFPLSNDNVNSSLPNNAYMSKNQSINPSIPSTELYTTSKALAIIKNLIDDLVRFCTNYIDTPIEALPENHNIPEAIKRLTNFIAFRCSETDKVATEAASNVLNALYSATFSNPVAETRIIRSIYLSVLFAFSCATSIVTERITKWYSRQEQRYGIDFALGFLRWQLLRPSWFDSELVGELDKGRNVAAVELSAGIIKMAMAQTDTPMLTCFDIPHLLDQLELIINSKAWRSDLLPNNLLMAARGIQHLNPIMQARRNAAQSNLADSRVNQPQIQQPLSSPVQPPHPYSASFYHPGPDAQAHPVHHHQPQPYLVPPQIPLNNNSHENMVTYLQMQLSRALPPNVLAWFSEWVTLWQNTGVNGLSEQVQHQYVQQLQNCGLISFSKDMATDTEMAFYRGIIEAAVLSYLLLCQIQANAYNPQLQANNTKNIMNNNPISSTSSNTNTIVTAINPSGGVSGNNTNDGNSSTSSAISAERSPLITTADQTPAVDIQPYSAVEACARLFFLISLNHLDRCWFLQRILFQTSSLINADFQAYPMNFNQRPYFHFIVKMLTFFGQHLNQPIMSSMHVPVTPVTTSVPNDDTKVVVSTNTTTSGSTNPTSSTQNDSLKWLITSAFAEFLFDCNPRKYPGFAFAWLELASHKTFMPKLIKNTRGWSVLHKLLLLQLAFLRPYLAQAKLPEAIGLLYEGTLRVFLVLLHDAPEFLSSYHHTFCDALPRTCIQLRNLILSAFPLNMKLPDPTSSNLKLDSLPEIKDPPQLLSDYQKSLIESSVKDALDAYLKQPNEYAQFLIDLPSNLKLANSKQMEVATSKSVSASGSLRSNPKSMDGHASSTSLASGKSMSSTNSTTYDLRLINALVLYVGIVIISNPVQNSIMMSLFEHLARHLDAEGRYHFFNAFVNQLRYPNSHTHFFSTLLLRLWELPLDSDLRHQQIITRILVERINTNRPHPWGLLITCRTLSKTPRYQFSRVVQSPDLHPDLCYTLRELYAKGYLLASSES